MTRPLNILVLDDDAENAKSLAELFSMDDHRVIVAHDGEEAIEAILAAVNEDRDRVIAESADVLYHLLVMLRARGIALAEIEALVRAGAEAGGDESDEQGACGIQPAAAAEE